MATGAQPSADQPSSTPASVENLRREIQQLVSQGIESSRFELTRQCSLASGDRKSQTNFAKTIQGMANAYPAEERVYVVGADQKEKKFYPLGNEGEFDPANLHQILEKYLEPPPNFEAYTLPTDNGIKFAAIAVTPDQRRPIVAKTSVQDADGKTQLLQQGDVWVKKQTGLYRASHEDLEKMYETRIETEAERRAQQRFADMRDGLEARLRLQLSPERRIPSEDLVFGPDAEYQAYIEQLLANQDALRFQMLMTNLRDILVEKWHLVNAYDPEAAFKVLQFDAKVGAHMQNTFYPGSRRLVYAGLLLIKHGLNVDWFERVADLLIETFGVCGKLVALAPPGAGAPAGQTTRGTAALEVLLGARALSTYAVRRERYGYLSALMKNRWVRPVSSRDMQKCEPFLFWPLRMNVVGNDRIAYTWQQVVHPYWLVEFFGSEESFLDAACKLEFILHLNSYLATEVPEAKQWVSQYRPGTDFSYWYMSDLWRYPLEPIVPLAQKIYAGLADGTDAPLLLDFSVEHAVFQKAFSSSPQEVFVRYLKELLRWQTQAASSCGRFPPAEPDWGAVLGPQVHQSGS